MEINDADVAELVDARDLKSLTSDSATVVFSTENTDFAKHEGVNKPAEMAGNPPHLQNAQGSNFSVNKVKARGRRYAYLRGTGIVLVKGFIGTDDEFNEAIQDAARDLKLGSGLALKGVLAGHRYDAAKLLHKATKGRAQTKGRPYSLSIDLISERLKIARDRCEITGLRFDYGPRRNDQWMRRPLSPSIDRIDNQRGYECDNIRIVCTCVNIAINEWGLENFETVCRAFVAKNAVTQGEV